MREVDRKMLALHMRRSGESALSGAVVVCLGMWLLFVLFGCNGQIEQEAPRPGERVVEVRNGVPVYSDVNEGLKPLDADEGLKPLDADEVLELELEGLGQTSQPLLFAPSGSRQPGFIPDIETSCTINGGSSQNCIVPPMENGLVKGFTYYLEGGYGPRISGVGVARFDVYSQLNAMWSDLVAQGAYTTGTLALDYGETLDLGDPALTFVIEISGSGDFCSGSSSKGNVCFTGSTTGISHDSSLVGTYHRMVNAPAIHIDYEAIRTKAGWTTTQKKNALHQAISLAFLKGIGQGPVSNPNSTRCDQTAVTTEFWCTLPPNAACKLNGWGDFGTNNFIDILGSDCGN